MQLNNKSVYRLSSCVWEITLKCCFSCKYCGSKAGNARENELSTDECINVAEQLGELGCKRVSLIGGEVFMRPDWKTIVKALKKYNIKVSIITNGAIISDKIISDIKELKIESVAVSIDGPEKIHDSFREKGSFNKAINAVDTLSKNGIFVSVISTLHSKNYNHLDEIYETLKEKDIFAWQIQACSPMGNALNKDFSTEINFNQVIEFVENHNNSPFVIGLGHNIGYYSKSERTLRGTKNIDTSFLGCTAGLTNIGIDSVGNVRGCESMYDDRFIEGNLREVSLSDIWNSPNSFLYNRHFTPDMLEGKCKNCKVSYKCAGGCRSYNYFTSGDIYNSIYCVRE